MNVSNVGTAQQIAPMSEKMEGPGPDHDGDADDMGAAAASTAKPAAPQGMGLMVDKTA